MTTGLDNRKNHLAFHFSDLFWWPFYEKNHEPEMFIKDQEISYKSKNSLAILSTSAMYSLAAFGRIIAGLVMVLIFCQDSPCLKKSYQFLFP